MKSPQHLNCILEFIWEHALELFSSYIYRLVTCYYKNMTRINFLGDLMTNVNSMSDPCGSCNRFWQQVTTSLTGHKKLIRIKNREVHSRLLCRIFSKHNQPWICFICNRLVTIVITRKTRTLRGLWLDFWCWLDFGEGLWKTQFFPSVCFHGADQKWFWRQWNRRML